MESVIDRVETANRVSEVNQLISENTTILSERASLQRQFASTWPRQDAVEAATACLLSRPLSVEGLHDLTRTLIPEWDKGRLLDALTRVRDTGTRTWLLVLLALVENGRMPVISAFPAPVSVSALRESHRVCSSAVPFRRCGRCDEEWIEWVEDVWSDRLHRICLTCGNDNRTQIKLPPSCTQLPLF